MTFFSVKILFEQIKRVAVIIQSFEKFSSQIKMAFGNYSDQGLFDYLQTREHQRDELRPYAQPGTAAVAKFTQLLDEITKIKTELRRRGYQNP